MEYRKLNFKIELIITPECCTLIYACSRLFARSISSHSRIFQSYGAVTNTSEGLQSLTCTRHSWPLNSDGSSKCHTYCDTGQFFIIVISEDPWHSRLMTGRLAVELSLPVLTTKVCPDRVSNPDLPHARRTLYHYVTIRNTIMSKGENVY